MVSMKKDEDPGLLLPPHPKPKQVAPAPGHRAQAGSRGGGE